MRMRSACGGENGRLMYGGGMIRAIGLAFACLAVAPGAWAQLGQVNLTFQDADGAADTTIFVTVRIDSFVGASTVFFKVDVDAGDLALTHVFPRQSATTANKEITIGQDAMGNPTILVSDFGGGNSVIPNGDLVLLVFRAAAGLTVGEDIPVSGSEASAATPAGSLLSTAVFGGTVDIEGCAQPSAVSILAASNGTLADRVALGWFPVEGATEYVVFRNTTNNFGASEVLAVVEDTQYDDLSAAAATVMMGGCQGQDMPQFQGYHYWVVVSNACGFSPPSPPVTGFRGLAMADARAANEPLHASAGPMLLFAAAGLAWAARRYPRVDLQA
jgi:hypothetical protein